MRQLPKEADGKRPIVLAHRGWRGRFPENTMLAFGKAAELPIDGLEMDIHSTADGELVVIHDDTVDRTTNGRGLVNGYTLAQLKALDAGYRWTEDDGRTFPFRSQGITIPTLREVFEAFPHLWINVDIKQQSPQIVRPFANLIRHYNMADNMFVGSFDNKTVAAFRREMPHVETAASLNEVLRLFLLNKLRLGRVYWGRAAALQIPEQERDIRLITPRFVAAARRNRVPVHVWTVNETADMERLLDWGVDGLISDFPDRALALLRARRRQRVTLFLVQDDKVLLLHRYRNGRSYYVLPGGGVEPGETVVEAAHREAMEETSLHITLGPKLWQRPIKAHSQSDEHAFLVTEFRGELRLGGPEAAAQSDENRYAFAWVSLDALIYLPVWPGPVDVTAVQHAVADGD